MKTCPESMEEESAAKRVRITSPVLRSAQENNTNNMSLAGGGSIAQENNTNTPSLGGGGPGESATRSTPKLSFIEEVRHELRGFSSSSSAASPSVHGRNGSSSSSSFSSSAYPPGGASGSDGICFSWCSGSHQGTAAQSKEIPVVGGLRHGSDDSPDPSDDGKCKNSRSSLPNNSSTGEKKQQELAGDSEARNSISDLDRLAGPPDLDLVTTKKQELSHV